MNRTQRAEAIRRIYESIPKVACKRICGPDYCGPIKMSPLEFAALKERFPELALVNTQWGPTLTDGCDTCPLLAPDGSCRAYDLRPAICRVFGATMALQCRHGCQPERMLSETESRHILRAISALGA